MEIKSLVPAPISKSTQEIIEAVEKLNRQIDSIFSIPDEIMGKRDAKQTRTEKDRLV